MIKLEIEAMKNNKLIIKKLKKIHFTGIKGVGMTALALCAKDLGIKISGSDIAERFVTDKTLAKAKIKWKLGFKKENVGKADLLIYTAAHNGRENIEVKAALKKNIPVMSHGRALGLLMEGKTGISVCGVGGKTTTAAMIATIFKQAKFNPSYAIGAGWIKPLGFPGKYDKKGKYFIAEADEYFASPQDLTPRFLYQNPKIIVITNIEFDHPDVYKNIKQTIKAFVKFAKKIPSDGLLVAGIDNPNIKKLLEQIKAPTITFGMAKEADWRITLINQSSNKVKFKLKHKNKEYFFNLLVPGEFNLKNAAAAIAVSYFCQIPIEQIKKGILLFKGTERRLELIRQIKGVKFYDDYAHHPQEIKATLKAIKKSNKNCRLIAIFQPHTYSRTKALFAGFCRSFSEADKVFIAPVYASAREKNDLGISGKKLAAGIKKNQPGVEFVSSSKEAAMKLKKILKKGDLIITLGAGDIFKWQKKIIKALK